MKKILLTMAVLTVWSSVGYAQEASKPAPEEKKPANPIVKMVTNKGEIHIELFADKAPITVKNFLNYVNEGFYNDTIFHRLIKGFMIQGGGMTADLKSKKTKAPIRNESYNKVRNKRGTIAMARTNAPDSATSQFFINHVDNKSLDFDGPMAPGYAVFGQVFKGMQVVDAIAEIPTKRVGPHGNVPVETVMIKSVTMIKSASKEDHDNDNDHEEDDDDHADEHESEHSKKD
jgi:cyclophilin family peptidyl-prolyl cis-trans isomerase